MPPFRVEGRWVRVGDEEDAICCIPSAYTLFQTWAEGCPFCAPSGHHLVLGVPVVASVSAIALKISTFCCLLSSSFSCFVAAAPSLVIALVDSWPATRYLYGFQSHSL